MNIEFTWKFTSKSKFHSVLSLELNQNLISFLSSTACNEIKDNDPSERKTGPENWKRTILKNLRQSGRPYINSSGYLVDAKSVEEPCNDNCGKKCRYKISEDQRQVIFDHFWTLNDAEKRMFYHENVSQSLESTVNHKSKRRFIRKFTFTVNGVQHEVCRIFFVKTLGIQMSRIDYFLREQQRDPENCTKHRHGRFSKTKLPKKIVDKIKEHIRGFPRMDPYYTDGDTTKELLEPGMSLTKMHKLFLKDCGVKVCYNSYQKVFKENFSNVMFFK